MTAALIGVTTSRIENQSGYTQFSTSQAYIQSVVNAGGSTVLIPSGLSDELLDELLVRLDGLLLTGGGDIQSERYGSSSHPKVQGVDIERDRVELHLVQQALRTGKPTLGICRGLQVINVALGGSLYEDISDQRPDSIQHRYYPDWPRDYLAHEVSILEDSTLAGILESVRVEVNSLHHQGIKELGAPLQETAFAPDGLIEAIEFKDTPYVMAVQWHPENLQDDPGMRSLFRWLVEAAEACR
jgi:putative glutamine amidotransferase